MPPSGIRPKKVQCIISRYRTVFVGRHDLILLVSSVGLFKGAVEIVNSTADLTNALCLASDLVHHEPSILGMADTE